VAAGRRRSRRAKDDGLDPIITFVHVLVDAMNAMKVVPGQFKSFGHDYRGDTARFVEAAFHFPPVTDEQMDRVNETLLQLEVDRGERIKQAKEAAEAESGDGPTRGQGPLWIQDRTKTGDGKVTIEPMAARPSRTINRRLDFAIASMIRMTHRQDERRTSEFDEVVSE
jgi:hypothetical protein